MVCLVNVPTGSPTYTFRTLVALIVSGVPLERQEECKLQQNSMFFYYGSLLCNIRVCEHMCIYRRTGFNSDNLIIANCEFA